MTTTTQHNASPVELDAIAELVFAIRPRWETGLVRAVLLAHVQQVDAGDLAVAAIRAAQNMDYRTPKTIGWRGPHWDGARTKPLDQQRLAYCRTCGKREDKCETQRIGLDDDHAFEPSSSRPRWDRR